MNEAREALRLLKERGWCKGQRQDEQGRMCISGALHAAVGTDPHDYFACWHRGHRAVIEVIRTEYPDAEGFISFNDPPDTTFADVERVLEKAAVRLDEVV